jgi:hypothetical protein
MTLFDAVSEEICPSGATMRCGERWGRGCDECERDFAVCDSGGGSVGQRQGGFILRHVGIFVREEMANTSV